MNIDRDSRLNDVMKTSSGHDIIARLLYSLGLDENVVTKTPLGHLRIKSLKTLSMGRLDDASIDALLRILNSLQEEADESEAEIKKAWWKETVFYQIYPRSFFDSDNDGIGDIRGIIRKLDHIKSLGADAIWVCPFYDSPGADNGYDIRDYRKIAEEYGTMKDAEELIEECHKRGMKLIIDLVMNHTSDEHEWFQKALRGETKYGDYYIWKYVPNNWTSFFSGSAWRYFDETKKYALHLFAEKQMDLNWDNPRVREEMYDIADFWLDKGADGFRLDVVSFISKSEGLPDGDPVIGSLISFTGVEHYFHGPRLDQYLREFNERCLKPHGAYAVGECPGSGLKMSRMIAGDDRNELTQLFSFDHIENPGKTRMDVYDFDLKQMVRELVRWQENCSDHYWPTLFFNNHDNPRMCYKIDRSGRYRKEVCEMLAVLQMTLKGTPYIYQGDEIGMTCHPFPSMDGYRDVESLNLYRELKDKGMSEEEILKKLSYGSRDLARTPVQWTGGRNAGFSEEEPWIGVGPDYETVNAETEENDEGSILNFYRKMIKIRKENEALIYGSFERIKTNKNILAYRRRKDKNSFVILINLTDRKQNDPLRVKGEILISNYPDKTRKLRPYEAVTYKENGETT